MLSPNNRNLIVRFLSTLILGPLVLAMIWKGGWMYVALIAAAFGIAAWEWSRLTEPQHFKKTGPALVLSIIAVTIVTYVDVTYATDKPVYSLLFLLSLALLWGAAARYKRLSSWLTTGMIYLGLGALSAIGLRILGRGLPFFLLAVIWATDTGALIFGRSIGGPKLAPRISPNKTWAGFFGGTLCGFLAAGLFMGLYSIIWDPETMGGIPFPFTLPDIFYISLAGVFLSIVGQISDLFKSLLKRKAGVKDSGNLIPGHGGMLDRIDSLILAAPALLLLIHIFQGS